LPGIFDLNGCEHKDVNSDPAGGTPALPVTREQRGRGMKPFLEYDEAAQPIAVFKY
jgi:hypothetical protein